MADPVSQSGFAEPAHRTGSISALTVYFFFSIFFLSLQVKEMEISKSKAEQKLRENNGNIVQTLIELTN